MKLFNETRLLEKSLDASMLRQKVIANNIANMDTPYFKRSVVKFEEFLRQELLSTSPFVGKRTDPRHIPIGKTSDSDILPEIVRDDKTAFNHNQNNVDIDYEMALMAKNQLYYNVLVQQLNHEFKMLRKAIEGR